MNSSTSKVSLDSMSRNIVQAIANIKDSKEFDDFQVEVEGKIFSCHSFVLLSCSEFFRGMLRSNMREKQDRTVRLTNISAATFQLILDTLYTGDDMLTTDNLIDVWHAVHQLQIAFLMEYCEDFVESHLTMDNLELYKRHAEFLHSWRARAGVLKFIMKNFSSLRETELFLNLDIEDMMQIIESDELVVDSEDLVMFSVYEWVNYGEILAAKHEANKSSAAGGEAMDTSQKQSPNHRKKYLAQILSCTRYCNATESCIFKLYQHALTTNDTQVKDILFKASSFKLNNYLRGVWPNAAIYRNCWGYEHVSVYCNTVAAQLVFTSLKRNTPFDVKGVKPLSAIKLAVFNDRLFACTSTRGNIEIFTLENQLWIRVCAYMVGTWDKCLFLLSHGDRIFVFSKKKMRHFSPNDMRVKFTQSPYTIAAPEHALSFHNQILIFGSVDNGSAVEETAVHSWNSEREKWTQLDNLTFSPKDMASFEDDADAYILDTHGNMWKLMDANTVEFTFIGKLWDLNLKLTGALLFRKTLYVYIDYPASVEGINVDIGQSNGVFLELKFVPTGAGVSNSVHMLQVQSKEETPGAATNM